MVRLNLVGLYNEATWERGGKRKEHKKFIGKNYISWSTCESFNDKAGFNTGLLGEYEYILNKLSKVKFPDMGWGDFGSQVEAYITLRDKKDLKKFDKQAVGDFEVALKTISDTEKETLNKIEPLGVFQYEICYYIEELDIIVLGYIDDYSPVEGGKIRMLRDYKTKSESSKKDLHLPKKYQMELYILGLRQQGYEVQNAEYCIIERFGGRECMNGGGRESLTVGDRIWYEPYTWTEKRLEETVEMIKDTAKRISSIKNTYDLYFS